MMGTTYNFNYNDSALNLSPGSQGSDPNRIELYITQLEVYIWKGLIQSFHEIFDSP